MSTTLIAVVAALVLGHLAQSMAASVATLRLVPRLAALAGCALSRRQLLARTLGHWSIALVPIGLLVALFQVALHGALFGLPSLLFGVARAVLCLGSARSRPGRGSRRRRARSRQRAAPPPRACGPKAACPRLLDGGSLVEAVFRNAQHRWFGVLFWFLLLGPVGALLYRLVALSAEGEAASALPAHTRDGARTPDGLARLAGRAADDAVAGAGRQLRHRARCLARRRRRIVRSATSRSSARSRAPA